MNDDRLVLPSAIRLGLENQSEQMEGEAETHAVFHLTVEPSTAIAEQNGSVQGLVRVLRPSPMVPWQLCIAVEFRCEIQLENDNTNGVILANQ